MSGDSGPRRPVGIRVQNDGVARPELGERTLWAAVLKRALADACGMSHNREARREARRWFRQRSQEYIGGWGYVIEVLDLPASEARRVERAAQTDGFDTGLSDQDLGG